MTLLRSPSVTPVNQPRPRVFHIDTVSLLSLYVLLLVAIPTALVFSPLGAAGSPATIYAAALMGFYLVVWVHPGFDIDTGRQPVRVVSVLLMCTVIAAYVSANRHSMPGLEKNAADRGLISMFGWTGVAVVAADGIESLDRLRTLLRRVVIGVSAMASLAIAQFFTGLDATKYIVIPGLTLNNPDSDLAGTRGGLHRPSATAAHPLELAACLAIGLALAIHQARFGPRGRPLRRWLPVVLIGVALPLTLSRTAILGLVVLIVVLLPTWPVRDRRRGYVVLVVSLVGMWLTIPHLAGTFRDLFGGAGSDTSTLSRTSSLSEAAKYTVTDAPDTTGPVLLVTVTGSARAPVESTLVAVTNDLHNQLSHLQSGITPANQIRIETLSVAAVPSLSLSKLARPLAVVVIFGLLFTFAVPLIVDSRSNRRKAKKWARSANPDEVTDVSQAPDSQVPQMQSQPKRDHSSTGEPSGPRIR